MQKVMTLLNFPNLAAPKNRTKMRKAKPSKPKKSTHTAMHGMPVHVTSVGLARLP